MEKDYLPIDIRQLKDKNRVSLSNDLVGILDNPEIIVFSKYTKDGEIRIIANNKDSTHILGDKIDEAKIDNRQRCTITKPVQRELGLDKDEKKFVGFFMVNIGDYASSAVELAKVVYRRKESGGEK